MSYINELTRKDYRRKTLDTTGQPDALELERVKEQSESKYRKIPLNWLKRLKRKSEQKNIYEKNANQFEK